MSCQLCSACPEQEPHLQKGDAQNVVHEAHCGRLLSWRRGIGGSGQVLDA